MMSAAIATTTEQAVTIAGLEQIGKVTSASTR
jgi:hypothetical protein